MAKLTLLNPETSRPMAPVLSFISSLYSFCRSLTCAVTSLSCESVRRYSSVSGVSFFSSLSSCFCTASRSLYELPERFFITRSTSAIFRSSVPRVLVLLLMDFSSTFLRATSSPVSPSCRSSSVAFCISSFSASMDCAVLFAPCSLMLMETFLVVTLLMFLILLFFFLL